MTHVLVAEDEARIASFVAQGLRSEGYTVTAVASGDEALFHAESGDVDLLVLDIGLPVMDGFEVLRRLRAGGSALPVIVLTARDSVADTVAGLDQGADDYMAKPFSFAELVARVRRRTATAQQGVGAPSTQLEVGGVSLDVRTRRVSVDGGTHDLTAREFTMLEMFLRHPDQVLSREQLLDQVWGYDYDPGSNVVDVYVRYLRRKVGAEHIETVRGMGYRWKA
jgi:DNA-binding response OmpR family regulator